MDEGSERYRLLNRYCQWLRRHGLNVQTVTKGAEMRALRNSSQKAEYNGIMQGLDALNRRSRANR